MKFVTPLFCLLAAISVVHASETKPLRVMSWNIHHGVGMDHKLDIARIASFIDKEKPDLVVLQEVDHLAGRSKKIDETAELAKLTGMTGIFGKAMDFDGGGYGQAILSRHPILTSKVHPLPSGDEPRIAFEATISFNDAEMKIISAHLDLNAAKRLIQVETLTNLCKDSRLPIILTGDFNATPGSPSISFLEKNHWKTVPKTAPSLTSPADKPVEEIDHFFLKGFTQTAPVKVLPEAVASDHRSILGDFTRD